MLRAVIAFAACAAASAFAPTLPSAGVRAKTSAVSGMKMQQMSQSVPFLPRPAALDGKMVGDVGFDPFGFSSKYDIKWLRESELKHGRVCMLASLGYIVQEFVHLPFEATSNPVGSEAFYQVPAGGLWQIFAFIGAIEHFSHNFKMSGSTMFSDGRTPGNFGFDPLGFGKNPQARARYELAELKNGRLAMLGFSGMIHGSFITGKGPINALLTLDWHQKFN